MKFPEIKIRTPTVQSCAMAQKILYEYGARWSASGTNTEIKLRWATGSLYVNTIGYITRMGSSFHDIDYFNEHPYTNVSVKNLNTFLKQAKEAAHVQRRMDSISISNT